MAEGRYHHGNLREALVETAAALISARGVDGWSISAASRELGVTHAAAYKHFANKAALVDAVTAEQMRTFAEDLSAAHARETEPRAQLLATGRVVLETALADPALFLLTFGPGRRDDLASLSSPPEGSAIERLVAMVRGWQRARYLREGDAFEIAIMLWATAHGLASLVATGRLALEPDDARARLDRLLLTLRDGLAPAT